MANIVLAQRLAQEGVKEVPDRFIKPPQERPTISSSSAHHSLTPSIPVIDLAGLQGHARSQTLVQIDEACRDGGFFQVVNHGIPSALIQSVKDVGRKFFELPYEEKLKCAMKPGGILGYGRHYSLLENAVLDWNDCLVNYAYPVSLRDEENTWPAKPLEYQEVMTTYAKEIQKLVHLLLDVISENLGLPPTYLEQSFGEFTLSYRINYYPPCPQPDLVMGLSPHSDIGCITFVIQDEVEGLQVSKNGSWVTVHPLEDALVVNLADMFQVITNGRYVSAEHRVVVNNVKERISVSAFYAPSSDAVISPTRFVDEVHPAIYKETNYGAYAKSYLSKPLEGKARVGDLSLEKINSNV